MDASLLSFQGRLARKPFWLAVIAIYLAGIAAQTLLSPDVTARGGLWPFMAAQILLIWAWLVIHVRRLRDAGQGPAAAIGVALIYALAVALLIMLILFLTNPNTPADQSASDVGFGLMVIVIIFGLLFAPDFGTFMTILKVLVFIACLPPLISLAFSVWTGLRPSTPP
jgi:uncharacterized membrane protein YhaH (DUF805 family)